MDSERCDLGEMVVWVILISGVGPGGGGILVGLDSVA